MNDSTDHGKAWLRIFLDLGYLPLVTERRGGAWTVLHCASGLQELLGLSELGPLEGLPELQILDELASRSVAGATLRQANERLLRDPDLARTDVLRLARPVARTLERCVSFWPGSEDRRLWLFRDVSAQEASKERYKRKSLHEEMLTLLLGEVLDGDPRTPPQGALAVVTRALGANGAHLVLLDKAREGGRLQYSHGATPLDLTPPMVDELIQCLAVARAGLLRFSAGHCPEPMNTLFEERPGLILLAAPVRSFDLPAALLLVEFAQLRNPGSDEGRFLNAAALTLGLWCRQRQAAGQLDSAALRVQGAEAARTEFMAIVSHEFRSPLGPIMALSQMLLDGCDCQDPGRRQMLGQINQASTQLHELVEDLLTITRLDSGAEQSLKYPVDLRLLGETAEGCFRVFSKGRSLQFVKQIPNDAGHINADGAAMKRAIRALVSNAVRFSPEGGQVLFTVTSDPGWVTLVVSDAGPGISEDMLQRMFSPFVQAEPALTRRRNGAGLGLTLVQRLARSHGGSILGRNNEPGPGATFELTLPRILPEDEETIP